MQSREVVSLPVAAIECRMSWPQAYAAMTRGAFGQPEFRGGRWYVERAAVERYKTEHHRDPTPAQLAAEAAVAYPGPEPWSPAPSGARYRVRNGALEIWDDASGTWLRCVAASALDVRHVAALLDVAEREAP